MRTYKYRIYPNREQQAILLDWQETCRLLYNKSLAERIQDFLLRKYLYFQNHGATYHEAKKRPSKKARAMLRLKKQLNWDGYYHQNLEPNFALTSLDNQFVFEWLFKVFELLKSKKEPSAKVLEEFNDEFIKEREKILSKNYRQKIIDKKNYHVSVFNETLKLNDLPIAINVEPSEKEIIKDSDLTVRVIDDLTNITKKQYLKLQRAYCKQLRNGSLDDLTNHFDQKFMMRVKRTPAELLDTVIRSRVPRALDNFFSGRAGYPHFKKFGSYGALLFHRSGWEVIVDGNLAIFSEGANRPRNKILSSIPLIYHRELPPDGKVKTVEISQTGDRWYASIVVEEPSATPFWVNEDKTIFIPQNNSLDRSNIVGIDVGIKQLLVLSEPFAYRQEDGAINETTVVNLPKNLLSLATKIVKKQKNFSRKQAISFDDEDLSKNQFQGKNRKKALVALQKAHADMTNRKNNFLYATVRQIVEQFDYIVLEDLEVSKMVRPKKKKDGSKHKKGERALKKGFNKALLECSFYRIRQIFIEECKKLGKALLLIDPAYTTILCSKCGRKVWKSLSTRTHICYGCGLELDRDSNAAKNIQKKGLKLLSTYL